MLDWRTGKGVWRVRTGADGTYNDDYQIGAIRPVGNSYQSVIGGIVKIHERSSGFLATEPSVVFQPVF
jgi:hypothetical protein